MTKFKGGYHGQPRRHPDYFLAFFFGAAFFTAFFTTAFLAAAMARSSFHIFLKCIDRFSNSQCFFILFTPESKNFFMASKYFL
jgi:hypothetical protein